MSNYEFNLAQLKAIALALGDLLPEVVFVGGCTTALLVDQSALSGVRQTMDVDVIVDVTTYVGYQRFSRRLREKGFVEDTEGPTCRWLLCEELTTIKLDVMPMDEQALGFSNRWYPAAIENSVTYPLAEDLSIKVVSPIYFLATKFEAFSHRGNGDFYSHDLEDIVFVFENRTDLMRLIFDAPLDLKDYFAQKVNEILGDDFLNVLPGMLNNESAAKIVHRNLMTIAGRPWA